MQPVYRLPKQLWDIFPESLPGNDQRKIQKVFSMGGLFLRQRRVLSHDHTPDIRPRLLRLAHL